MARFTRQQILDRLNAKIRSGQPIVGGGAGLDRLVFLESRLAEVDVSIDEPGDDDQSAGIEDLGLIAEQEDR